uniref:pentatricopeptide repeat-containing protein At4g32450, mitochondrial-like n=1 Tax=Erigeron canadensis TaxID=72917 RepID=UPI001CB8D3D3|nr:pentatricopeptide repeat-containing protein At4g32450, mitochondrial-like [Erigeron canadensis]
MSQIARTKVKSLNQLLYYNNNKVSSCYFIKPHSSFLLNYNNNYYNYHTNSSAAALNTSDTFAPYNDTNYNNNNISNNHFAYQNPNLVNYNNNNNNNNNNNIYNNTNFNGMYQETQGNYNMSSGGVSSNEIYNGNVNSDEAGRVRVTIEEFDALCKERKSKEAIEMLWLLEEKGVLIDADRCFVLMNACGEGQALEECKRVHEFVERMTKLGAMNGGSALVWNKVLEMYWKCGSMEDAYKVFDKMPERNLTSWDTMITWLGKNGYGEEAIDMFTEFKKVGLKPDGEMFFSVFSACSVVGDMKEGLLHLESMSKDYGIVPTADHYKSVVDMFGSAGYFSEALEFIEKMPMEPSVEIWETLMKQCRAHGDTELGDRCAEFIELLDPSHLDEQSKAGLIPVNPADIAKEKEKKRLSGLNPLEIKTKVYEYRAGDTSHPDHLKLYSQLRCLRQPMKEAGYVPETKFVLHDVDHESKEEALLSHSERLALSQALLTSPARAPIRIIKNLRVCGDCHNALKIISKLVGRLIIARDAKRFHHFENGACSCRDYW